MREPAATRDFPCGRNAEVWAMSYGKGRITVRRIGSIGIDQAWCYDNVLAAVAALNVWDGTDEPVGWFRNPFTGEIRPENTAQQLV